MKAFRNIALVLGLGFLVVAAAPNGVEGIEEGDANIDFYHGSFDRALSKAEEADKLVFVDVYADWCKPCKLLSKKTFTQEKVATFFNKNFINIKLDNDAVEHRKLMEKYNIQALPTLLFLDKEGEIVHITRGYLGSDQLIKEAEAALAKK